VLEIPEKQWTPISLISNKADCCANNSLAPFNGVGKPLIISNYAADIFYFKLNRYKLSTKIFFQNAYRDVKASSLYVVTYHFLLAEDSSPGSVFMAGGMAGRTWSLTLKINVKVYLWANSSKPFILAFKLFRGPHENPNGSLTL
jgi:hypothetical protein